MQQDFKHQHAAHCETGVMSSLIEHHGFEFSEAMALGLSSSLCFAYIPVVKLNGLPLIAYRMPPKNVIRGLKKVLGIRMKFEQYKDQDRAMDRLDEKLADGNVVGLQTSVYWLPYFPDDMRFHFNAHNLLVYGKEGDEYLISDPVFEEPMRCDSAGLKRARLARGALAPKGLMYYPEQFPETIDIAAELPGAIKKNIRIMNAPVPIAGIRGINYLANKIEKLADRPFKEVRLFIGHIVRMQEEIGTGGAGFRFLYASFLEEAADILDNDLLREMSSEMTEAGDQWRLFALSAVKMCKARDKLDLPHLASELRECAAREARVWEGLKQLS